MSDTLAAALAAHPPLARAIALADQLHEELTRMPPSPDDLAAAETMAAAGHVSRAIEELQQALDRNAAAARDALEPAAAALVGPAPNSLGRWPWTARGPGWFATGTGRTEQEAREAAAREIAGEGGGVTSAALRKAWRVRVRSYDFSEVVFAPTAGKARALGFVT